MRAACLCVLAATLVLGCEFQVPSGRFACDESSDCPPGQQCVEQLCVASFDAGAVDSGASDAGTVDSGAGDAGDDDAGAVDASMLDASTMDAGSDDAGTGDAGTGDAGTDGGATDAGTDAGTDSGPPPCNPTLNDCGAGQYCQATDCGSSGVCVARPTATANVHQPACGCNGVSYWNATHARWLGATAFTTGTSAGCGTTARTCMTNADCLAGTQCVIERSLGPSTCSTATAGRCWAIPVGATCTGSVPDPDVGFVRCGAPTGAPCVGLCEARLTGNYYTQCL